MQSGYGALNKLNYLLGVSPQTATGGAVNQTGGVAQPMGSLSSIGRGLPGAMAGSPQYWGPQNFGLGTGSATATQGMGAIGGSGLPVSGGSAAGDAANGGGYGSLTGNFTAQDYLKNQDPGYGFQLQQGTQALRNAAGAGSGALSGAALKDLIGYNQDYAKTGYGAAFDRFNTQNNNVYSRLSGLATLGQASAGNVAAQGTALAGQQSQALQAAGTAQGGMYAGIANNLGGGASNYWLSQTPSGQAALGAGGV